MNNPRFPVFSVIKKYFIALHIPMCTASLSLIIIDGHYYIKEAKIKVAYILFFPYPLHRLLRIGGEKNKLF